MTTTAFGLHEPLSARKTDFYMNVYILTEEPYHDNSVIVGVYDSEVSGLDALRTSRERPAVSNSDYWHLGEWDTTANKLLRAWWLGNKTIYDEIAPNGQAVRSHEEWVMEQVDW